MAAGPRRKAEDHSLQARKIKLFTCTKKNKENKVENYTEKFNVYEEEPSELVYIGNTKRHRSCNQRFQGDRKLYNKYKFT